METQIAMGVFEGLCLFAFFVAVIGLIIGLIGVILDLIINREPRVPKNRRIPLRLGEKFGEAVAEFMDSRRASR